MPHKEWNSDYIHVYYWMNSGNIHNAIWNNSELNSRQYSYIVILAWMYSCRAGVTSPVGQVSTGPLFSPSALTADLGDYDLRGSIDQRSTESTELAA